MPPISTKLHGAGDYATGVLMLAAPRLLPIRNRRAQALVLSAGVGVLLTSSVTDYELGLRRRLPMPAHLMLDAATGGLLLAGAISLRDRRGTRLPDWLPHALLGAGEIAAAALTQRQPADRSTPAEQTRPSDRSTTAEPTQPSDWSTAVEPPPQAPAGGGGEGAATPMPVTPLATTLRPAPLETPGPSVTAPAQPESETERAERIDAGLAGAGTFQTGDTLVAQQEAAAAAEAAAIGGTVPADVEDPAMDPVYQAGGGEGEGWEAAEADLIENATHDDGHAEPQRDAIAPENESDRATAVYGEADHSRSSELADDEGVPREEPPSPDR